MTNNQQSDPLLNAIFAFRDSADRLNELMEDVHADEPSPNNHPAYSERARKEWSDCCFASKSISELTGDIADWANAVEDEAHQQQRQSLVAEDEILCAVRNLKNAFHRLGKVWNEDKLRTHAIDNDAVCEKYPFGDEFLEIVPQVQQWFEALEEHLTLRTVAVTIEFQSNVTGEQLERLGEDAWFSLKDAPNRLEGLESVQIKPRRLTTRNHKGVTEDFQLS